MRNHLGRFEHVFGQLLLFVGAKARVNGHLAWFVFGDGRPTDGVDAMHKAWHGEWPEKRTPSIRMSI